MEENLRNQYLATKNANDQGIMEDFEEFFKGNFA